MTRLRALSLVVATLVAFLMVPVVAVRAEIARLLVGPNQFGQGWLFLDSDGRCKVLTAGHVVAPGGALVRVLVLDRRGRQLEADPPEVLALPPDGQVTPDLALLPVRTAGDSEACSRSRLSLIGADRRLQTMRFGVIQTTARSETLIVPIERLASRRDSAGGEVFAVRPRDPAVTFSQGWSGSIVLDDEGPLGVIVAAPDDSEATVLRVDVLSRLARRAPLPPPDPTIFERIVVIRGESVDPSEGPSGALRDALPPWAVRPDRGWVAVQLSAAQPQMLSRVVVELDPTGGAAIRRLEVEVGLGERAGWALESVRSCLPSEPAHRLSCGLLEQTRSLLQISLQFNDVDQVLVRRIRVE